MRDAPGAPAPRPRTLWRLVGLVAIGGTVGTALRQALLLLAPDPDRFPVTTFAVNLAGAFALGVLLEVLVRSGPDEGRRRDLRLLVGTGVLGGFTTYSALAAATVTLAASGLPAWAMAYALGTVVLGAVLSVAGVALGGALVGRRPADGMPGRST